MHAYHAAAAEGGVILSQGESFLPRIKWLGSHFVILSSDTGPAGRMHSCTPAIHSLDMLWFWCAGIEFMHVEWEFPLYIYFEYCDTFLL